MRESIQEHQISQGCTQLVQLLRSRGIVLASVESCTGGMIADQITNIAGASEHFWGSWIVYDSSAKAALGVSAQTISQHGAVSSETAHSLAENGLRQLFNALKDSDAKLITLQRPWKTLAVVSTTGIAGPSGGTPEKPVGLCHIGIAIANVGQETTPAVQSFKIEAPAGQSRIEYKTYFTEKALAFLLESLRK